MAIDLTQIDWEEYNPFKMWGAWVGAVWGLSYYLLTSLAQGGKLIGIGIIFLPFGLIRDFIIYNKYLFCLIPIIAGFLIGWGIHSLVRKLKK